MGREIPVQDVFVASTSFAIRGGGFYDSAQKSSFREARKMILSKILGRTPD